MNEQDFQEHGFAGCLHKPFTVKELLTIISGEEMTGSSAELTPDSLNFRALTAFPKMIRKLPLPSFKPLLKKRRRTGTGWKALSEPLMWMG